MLIFTFLTLDEGRNLVNRRKGRVRKLTNLNTEMSEMLRVSEIMTKDKVYIEAFDNVTEPTDNKRCGTKHFS